MQSEKTDENKQTIQQKNPNDSPKTSLKYSQTLETLSLILLQDDEPQELHLTKQKETQSQLREKNDFIKPF